MHAGSVLTNGPVHDSAVSAPADILLDSPPRAAVDHPLSKMNGRIYSHSFQDEDLDLAFYAMAASESVREEFETNILKNAVIGFKK